MIWLGPVGRPLVELIELAGKMIFRVADFIMWAAPVGAFGAIAFTVGKFGLGSLASLGKLLLGFYVTCFIFIFAVLWPLAHWVGFSLIKLLRYIWEELLISIVIAKWENALDEPRLHAVLDGKG